MNPFIKTSKWKSFGTGAIIGVVGSTLSMISYEASRVPLGYSPMSIKNFVKVEISTGFTAMIIIAVRDKTDEELMKIMNKYLPF